MHLKSPLHRKVINFVFLKPDFWKAHQQNDGKSWAVISCSPPLWEAQFYTKLSYPCQLSLFHTHLYITLIFGAALPSILSHPVPIPTSSSCMCLPDCVFELFPCTKTPSAQCIKTGSGKVVVVGFRKPSQSVNSCFVQKQFHIFDLPYMCLF